MMHSPDYVTNGEASSSVCFAPLFALVVHCGQLLVCVLCLGLPGTATGGGGKRVVLLCVAAVAALLCVWCARYPWRSCSLPCVGPIRAAGFAVVSFCACLCYIRDTDFLSSGSHWRDQTVLFPAAAVVFLVGCLAGIREQHRASQEWSIQLQAAGLGDALERVAGLGRALLVGEALGGTSDGAARRAQELLARAHECRSAPALGLLLVRFEEQVLAERLRFDFLVSRDDWRSVLMGGGRGEDKDKDTGGEAGGVSYDQVAEGAQRLQQAIRPRPPLAVVNKHLVAMVFINHLPEYVAWEVFKFMFDVTPLLRTLQPLLAASTETTFHGWAPTHALGLLAHAREAERRLRESLYAAQLQTGEPSRAPPTIRGSF